MLLFKKLALAWHAGSGACSPAPTRGATERTTDVPVRFVVGGQQIEQLFVVNGSCMGRAAGPLHD